MKNIWKNYKSTLILLLAIIAGAIVGAMWGEGATVLSPLGDIFLNILLVVIIPLIFFSITTAISKMKQPKRLGKITASIVGVILLTSVIAVLIGFAATNITKLVEQTDLDKVAEAIAKEEEKTVEEVKAELALTGNAEAEKVNFLDKVATLITVNDFSKLLTRDNLIALLVMSIIVGFAVNMAGEKADAFRAFLESANEVTNNVIKIIMYYAPIGLFCYLASFVGTFGSQIAVGFLKSFLIYLVVSLIYFFVLYTVYAFIAGGKKGVKDFWTHIWPAATTALATCSSAASMPVSIKSAEKMGVPNDVAEMTIPLGTSFHKDGSIVLSVFKLMFLVYLFGSAASMGQVLGVCLLATLLVTAVPVGGGTISEMLIISMMGFPVAALPILTIIATINDAPATVLNVVGNDTAAMMVARVVDGKRWNEGEREATKINKNKKK